MSRNRNASKRPSAGRGRPRDEQIDSEVVSAVLAVLRSAGYQGVTIDGIARQVGRARTSLYRRWPSKRHLVTYAVISELGGNPAPDTGTLRGDLTGAVSTLWSAFRGPLGHALPGLVGEMAQDSQLGEVIRQEVIATRRQSMRAAFARAFARGEVRDHLDTEVLLDMLTGPFYYRALFRHAPINRRLMAEVVEYVLRVAATEVRDRAPGRSEEFRSPGKMFHELKD